MEHYDKDGYYMHPKFPTNKIHHTVIIGENVKLGNNNVFMPYCVIGATGFIRSAENAKGKIVIGDSNVFGCYVNVMAGEGGETVVGNKNLVMNHSNIGHNVEIKNKCEVGAGTIVNGYAKIANNVRIKSKCVIRNRIVIGPDIVIGQGSNVTKNLLRPGTYYGNPVKPIELKPIKQG